ncbi:MAG: hypothetical protein PHG83_01385 [Patescibacteria group bacterium]|nr:hypothetical protein [Patescibacteria group bacterium]
MGTATEIIVKDQEEIREVLRRNFLELKRVLKDRNIKIGELRLYGAEEIKEDFELPVSEIIKSEGRIFTFEKGEHKGSACNIDFIKEMDKLESFITEDVCALVCPILKGEAIVIIISCTEGAFSDFPEVEECLRAWMVSLKTAK